MMITLSEPIMVSLNTGVAKHYTVNGGLLHLVAVLTMLVQPFAACALFLGDFVQFNPSRLSKRLNPELNGALTVKQPLSNGSIINQCFKVR